MPSKPAARSAAPDTVPVPAASAPSRVVPLRLQRFLARAGVASRRKSEDLMCAGRVRVNGEVVRELGSRVDPTCDVVTVDGREVHLEDGPTYLVLNKPAGVLTTMRDPHGRPCVAELVPAADHPGLFPVGRLDADTTGILLFTTDGDVGQALLHPSHHVDKRYLALVEGTPSRHALYELRRGVELEDGLTAPAEVRILARDDPRCAAVAPEGAPRGRSVVELTIHEGRKHQVKRMLAAVGHEVVRLHRAAFGPLELSGLAVGTWRPLTPDEVAAVRAATRATHTPVPARPDDLPLVPTLIASPTATQTGADES